jgi:dsDNA-specific endonuclease/ATPase MutS2
LSKNNHKNVTIKRHNFTKSERECVKGIIHNLSFQRLTDQEIVQWLLDEKEIDIDRSTVSKMRNQVETKAEKWYIELKKSTYKFVAVYKERIDSLFSYQKKLHEIIDSTKKPEVQLRAISELHSIEMSIFSLWKQLPDLQVDDRINSTDQNRDEFE